MITVSLIRVMNRRTLSYAITSVNLYLFSDDPWCIGVYAADACNISIHVSLVCLGHGRTLIEVAKPGRFWRARCTRRRLPCRSPRRTLS